MRGEDKFVVPEVRPVDKIRKDIDRADHTVNQVAAAPAPTATPKLARDTIPGTPAGSSTESATTAAAENTTATPPAQTPGVLQNGAIPIQVADPASTANPLQVLPGQSPAGSPANDANNSAAQNQSPPTFGGTKSNRANVAQLVGAGQAQATTIPASPSEHVVPTSGQANIPATPTAAAPPTATQTTLTAQQSAAAQTVIQPGNRTATAGSNNAASSGHDGARTGISTGTTSSPQPASIAAGADSITMANIAAAQPATAANAQTQTQTQNNSQILAQALANAAPEAGANPAPTPISPAVTGDTLGVTLSFNAEMRAAIDAPTQAAAYTARGAVTPQPATEQIAMQISRAANQGVDRLSVQLKPAELGKVTIDLEIGPDNRLLAVISAERSETLDLLQRDARSLEKALADAGVKTDSGSLEFNLQGDGGAAEGGRDGDRKLFDGAVMLPGEADGANTNGVLTNTPLILPEGRIDIQV